MPDGGSQRRGSQGGGPAMGADAMSRPIIQMQGIVKRYYIGKLTSWRSCTAST